MYIQANRRFLAYLGQLTTAFKLSSHLILQTSCKQSIKKGSAEESRAQGFQTSNLNPKGRNKIETTGENRDHLNSVCCFAHLLFLRSVHQTRARKRWKKRHREELCRGSHLWHAPPHFIGLPEPGMTVHILECHLLAFLSLCCKLKPTPALQEQSGCSQALEKCQSPENPSPVPLHRCITTHSGIIRSWSTFFPAGKSPFRTPDGWCSLNEQLFNIFLYPHPSICSPVSWPWHAIEVLG